MTKPSICAYLASVWGVIIGLTLNEVAILVGIFTAIGTFGVNWWYKHKESKSFIAALQGRDAE